MAEWIFFMHPDRENFAETMTEEERNAFALHFQWLDQLEVEGRLILAGPCLGKINTGVGVFEAANEAEAQEIVGREPVTRAGFMRPDLRPFRLGKLRRRDKE